MNEDFGIDFIARCIAGEGLETANKRQWKLQAGPRIILSDNPATQTTTISATGEDITVDDALSTTSENPVQNKVITNELLTKPTCVLPNGNKVNNQKIMQLTRAQYDAIQNKDPNTYYMITDDAADEKYTAGEGIDITNGVISLDVQYGASLEMTINPNTYVLTATLKDQDGGTLGTAQTVDLPLETMVVGGSYDDATKKVILTLQNGNTIEFSVADLVSGLETSAHAASTYLTQNDAANTYATQLTVNGLKTVPAVTSSDDGKILTADYTGGVASYNWETAPSGLPASTSSDSGKVLTVDSQGSPNWAAASGGLPSYTTPADRDKVLKLTLNGYDMNPAWQTIREVPPYNTYLGNGILRLNDNGIGCYWDTHSVPVPTANDEGKVLTAHYNSEYYEWQNTWETPSGGLPASTSADEGKVLTVDSSGDPGWSTLPSVDEVPDVTSSDDGKVLTASYSGGSASYSWQPAGGYTLPYASQSTKGGARIWTTTEGGETVLNIATEDPV